MNNLFEEHQYQRRLLPWLLVVVIWTVSIWHIYKIGISTEHIISDILILLILPFSITLLLLLLKLSIKIDKEYFMFKIFPFHRYYKKIKLNEIEYATIKEYNTDRSFHGWGIGIPWNKNYKSYTIKGYKGIEFLLINGNRIFIGSKNPNDIFKFIRKLSLHEN
jgi:hypothetical protein